MTRREKATQLFKEGYNCSQSVVGAFIDEIGIEKSAALKMASSFGGGMGGLREVCGAVSGMFMVLGLIDGYDEIGNYELKKQHYAHIRELADKFKLDNPSIVCKELLGISNPVPSQRNDEYYKKRPCPDLVGDAAQILEDYLFEHGLIKAKNV